MFDGTLIFILLLSIIGGLILGEILGLLSSLIRKHVPYGNKILDTAYIPFRVYMNFWRKILPDRLYQFWVSADVMTEEDYKAFYERGFIKRPLPDNQKNENE